MTSERAFTYLDRWSEIETAMEANMMFLMMFMKKVKGEPRQGYGRIYNTRPYPLGIRSMKREKVRPAAKEQK